MEIATADVHPSRERWALTGFGLSRMKAFLETRHTFVLSLELCPTAGFPSPLAASTVALLEAGRLPILIAALSVTEPE